MRLLGLLGVSGGTAPLHGVHVFPASVSAIKRSGELPKTASFGRHALVSQLLGGLGGLCEVGQTHAA
jgi:hypothetical protein